MAMQRGLAPGSVGGDRRNPWRRGRIIVSFFLVALSGAQVSSCGHGRNALPELSKETLALTQQAGNRALSPERRLLTAQELFRHRSTYDPILRNPSALASDQQRARSLQRSDGETAGATMHTIAEENLANGEIQKARAIYYSILAMFVDEEYASIRKAAENRLHEMDEREQRKKALQ